MRFSAIEISETLDLITRIHIYTAQHSSFVYISILSLPSSSLRTPVFQHRATSGEEIYGTFFLLSLYRYLIQNSELNVWHKRVAELTSRLAEVEENLARTQKELLKAQDTNSRLQRDLTENVAEKEDQVRAR